MNQRLSVNIRFAKSKDLDFCMKMDFKHINKAILKEGIEKKAVILAEVDERPVGYLRIEYLWHIIPYLGLIFIIEEYRKQGIGSAMITFLEEYLIKNGYNELFSSSQANEPEPQGWHRKIGFKECGFIAGINDGEIGEVFFRKRVGEKKEHT